MGCTATKGICCDCSSSIFKPFQKVDYENADLIFLAEIGQELDSGLFEVIFVEIYKGEINDEINILNPEKNYCSHQVEVGERWLKYGSKDDSGILVIDECSRSRNVERTKYWVPPPPPSHYSEKEGEKWYNKRYEKYINSDRGFIDDELSKLRQVGAKGNK